MDCKDHDKKHAPARERAETPTQALLVEKEANADGSDDLCEPVNEIVQRSGADTE